MGPVGAGVVTATFYNFRPELVARHVPAVWEAASPDVVLAARARAADATLRRLLGEEALRRRLGDGARERARAMFSRERMVATFKGLIDTVVQEPERLDERLAREVVV